MDLDKYIVDIRELDNLINLVENRKDDYLLYNDSYDYVKITVMNYYNITDGISLKDLFKLLLHDAISNETTPLNIVCMIVENDIKNL